MIEKLDYDEWKGFKKGRKVFSEKEEGLLMIEKLDCDM